jgi:CheY-like chemotaxis protein
MVRVLLVEDNDINAKLADALLSRKGYDVTWAMSGQESIEKVEEEEFDLVLMDIQMPGMDGIEATAEIRKFRSSRELPVLAMTAYTDDDLKERMENAGMNGIIKKPIKADILYEVLEKTVS